jgi:hypothetical protein
MSNPIKKALTVHKEGEPETPPSDTLVYGVYFSIVALLCLTALQATYMFVTGTFSNEIFAAMTLVIGTILGTFFGQKG